MAEITATAPTSTSSSAAVRPQARAHRERLWLALVLLVALVQGAIYMFLLPPWQHYDEPSHFEYAWLMAHGGYDWATREIDRSPPAREQIDALRREILASMIANGFYRDIPMPDPNAERVRIGFEAFQHPPGYYLLASLPLRLLDGAPLETQLYAARGVSLLLFVLTIGMVAMLVRELTAPANPLRWAVPLVLALLPPFVDLMTAVNSDAAAVAAGTFWLWGAVRLLRLAAAERRLTTRLEWAIAWVLLASVLLLLSKNTAALLLPLLPLVLLGALWLARGWHWRWLGLSLGLGGVLLPALLLRTGDAAAWYRWIGAGAQPSPTRTLHADAPHGQHALLLAATPDVDRRRLIQPVLFSRTPAGDTVTVGAWLWADQPVTVGGLGLGASSIPGNPFIAELREPLVLDTTPTFVAYTFDVPPETQALYLTFALDAPDTDLPATAQVYMDGVVLAVGSYPTATPPDFTAPDGTQGTWSGQAFTNLLRNPSAEQGWLRLNPWVEQQIAQAVSLGWGRTPSLLLATVQDIERSRELTARYVGWLPYDGLFDGLAWGNIRFDNALLRGVLRVWLGIALLGAGWWLWRNRRRRDHMLPAVLLVLLPALLLGWGGTLLRSFPRISEGAVLPVARYTYPVIAATLLLLIGGTLALVPRRLHTPLLLVLVGLTSALNIAAMVLVWNFYNRI